MSTPRTDPDTTAEVAVPGPGTGEYGQPLYTPAKLPAQKPPTERGPDPIVVPDCHLNLKETEDVPSRHDGVLLEVKVREGDAVKPGDLLAQVEYGIPQAELEIAQAKVKVAESDERASVATREEAKVRYDRQITLWQSRSTSKEDLDAAHLTWIRYQEEALSKHEAIGTARAELKKAQETRNYCEVRSAIPGIVKKVFKKTGEAVKSAPSYEPLFTIENPEHLKVEGMVEKQYIPSLWPIPHGSGKVLVEAAQADHPTFTLSGHLQEVTGVAVARDGKTIASSSADGTVRLWSAKVNGITSEQQVLHHPTPARAVACTPPGAEHNYAVSGTADGKLYIWDLDSKSGEPLKELTGHRRAVNCIAFSPNGKWFVSGGDDMEILLWETASGEPLYHFPGGHRAGVTSVQFTPQAQLISSGRDNTLRVWDVGTKGAVLKARNTIDRRSGDVTALGASPDGRRVLFDQGKALRLLSLPDLLTTGVLQNTTSAMNFNTFALFSPDSRLILTAGLPEGRLQLWEGPSESNRGCEIRQLVPGDSSPATCAAFSPGGSFIVSGNDRQVMVWPVPSKAEVDRQLTAQIMNIERSVEGEGRKVRITAEMENPENRLLKGDNVNLVIYPKER
jgi:WD40 repeat protein